MTNDYLTTEQAVKDKLGITDFRHMSKDKLVQFVSQLPNMDKELAIKCVEQFPHFKSFSLDMVKEFTAVCKLAMEEDGNESIKAYNVILEELRRLLRKRNITDEERHYIIDQMVDIGRHIEYVEDGKREFKEKVIRVVGNTVLVVISAGAAILGATHIIKNN